MAREVMPPDQRRPFGPLLSMLAGKKVMLTSYSSTRFVIRGVSLGLVGNHHSWR